jgi:hypothetical protein
VEENEMKREAKRLILGRETLRSLADQKLAGADAALIGTQTAGSGCTVCETCIAVSCKFTACNC